MSRGTRTGYIETNKILLATSGNSYTAKAKIITYRRPNGNTYGYISANDSVIVLGKYGNYTQIKYPVNNSYKYAFITTSDADRFIMGSSTSTIEGTYVIRSALNTNKVMDAYGNGPIQNGTNLQLIGYHGGDNQIYTLYPVGDGYYKIICKWGGKCVAILNASRENGANVILCDYNGTDNEKWRVVPAGDGSYFLQSKLNGNCLDVWGGRTEDETNIQSYQSHGGTNQRWRLTAVGNAGSPSSLLSENIGKVNYIKQGRSTCKATSLAMALNIITGTNTQTTSSMGNNSCRNINGVSYKGSNGATYVATYKTDLYVGSFSEEQSALDRAIANGLPAVAAVHKNGGTKHHWVLVVGKKGNDYLIVDPLSNGSGAIANNVTSMSAAKYTLGLTDYSTPHYGYITFTQR